MSSRVWVSGKVLPTDSRLEDVWGAANVVPGEKDLGKLNRKMACTWGASELCLGWREACRTRNLEVRVPASRNARDRMTEDMNVTRVYGEAPTATAVGHKPAKLAAMKLGGKNEN